MEHDRLEGTHSQPGYQHKPTNTAEANTVIEVVTSVIVITPPRASDSDFIRE
jgi:hypothetical protein